MTTRRANAAPMSALAIIACGIPWYFMTHLGLDNGIGG
jgi:hypothetical protein